MGGHAHLTHKQKTAKNYTFCMHGAAVHAIGLKLGGMVGLTPGHVFH